jgi:hypothetical protein
MSMLPSAWLKQRLANCGCTRINLQRRHALKTSFTLDASVLYLDSKTSWGLGHFFFMGRCVLESLGIIVGASDDAHNVVVNIVWDVTKEVVELDPFVERRRRLACFAGLGMVKSMQVKIKSMSTMLANNSETCKN